MTGILLDLVLLAILVAAVVLLYRLWPAGVTPREERSEQERRNGADRSPLLSGRFHSFVRQAGFEPERALWFYWPVKLVLALAFPLLLLEAQAAERLQIPSLLLAAVVGFFLPDIWLLMRRRSRRLRIQQALSYFLDLFVALLHSGLTLEEAFRRAGRQGLAPSHPLAREVRLVALEIATGRDRTEAFRDLGTRTGVPELRSVAAALNLAARHGVSVEAALATQADLLRTKRRENARREISAAATKSIFPLFLCGFPVFLVIVFFPAILEMIETFRALTGLL